MVLSETFWPTEKYVNGRFNGWSERRPILQYASFLNCLNTSACADGCSPSIVENYKIIIRIGKAFCEKHKIYRRPQVVGMSIS